MKAFSFIIAALFFVSSGFTPAPINNGDEEKAVKWYSFEEAVELSKKDKRKIFVDVYTDWCGWCKRMDKTTFSDPDIAKILNEKFYAVKLNAEDKAPVTFQGKEFVFKSEYKTHELALSLMGGRSGYPTTVYLDEDFNLLHKQPGYLTPDKLDNILVFFGDDLYKTEKWDEFIKNRTSDSN
jgi:thioredoxin-related protein